jgi:hypothetical protein
MIFLKRFALYCVNKSKIGERYLLNRLAGWKRSSVSRKKVNDKKITINKHNSVLTIYSGKYYKIFICGKNKRPFILSSAYVDLLKAVGEQLIHQHNTNLSNYIFTLINGAINTNDVYMAYIQCGIYNDVFITNEHLLVSLHKTKSNKQIMKNEIIALFEIESKFKRLIVNNNTLINYDYLVYLQNQLQYIIYHDEVSSGEDLEYLWETTSLMRDDIIIHQNGKKYGCRVVECE